jgi:SurA-like protein
MPSSRMAFRITRDGRFRTVRDRTRLPVHLRPTHVAALAILSAFVVAASGCDSGSDADETVAVVDGMPIPREQLEWAVERARAAADRKGTSFPDGDSDTFRRLRHKLLEQLVFEAEISKSASRLGVAVPTAAVYERAEEDSDEGKENDREIAFTRSSVRARLLYEAISRQLGRGVRIAPRRIELYYRSHRDEFDSTGAARARARVVIETRLLQQRQRAIMQRWVRTMKARFRPTVRYSAGY